LTKRERGLPVGYFLNALNSAGFSEISWSPCMFAATPFLARLMRCTEPFNSRLFVQLDALLSRTFLWNSHYHRTSLLQKFAPTSAFYIAGKAM
jgi:hypothetical protein